MMLFQSSGRRNASSWTPSIIRNDEVTAGVDVKSGCESPCCLGNNCCGCPIELVESFGERRMRLGSLSTLLVDVDVDIDDRADVDDVDLIEGNTLVVLFAEVVAGSFLETEAACCFNEFACLTPVVELRFWLTLSLRGLLSTLTTVSPSLIGTASCKLSSNFVEAIRFTTRNDSNGQHKKNK